MIKAEKQNDIITVHHKTGRITITEAEGKQLVSQLKKLCTTRAKYGNKKIVDCGREWDSIAELEFYRYLLTKHKPECIEIQPVFILQDKVYFGKNDPRNMQAIKYIADFRVGGVVYDVKGMQTQQGRLRVKMFKAKYPDLTLSLVNKCPVKYQAQHGKWIDIDVLAKLRKESKNAKPIKK